MTKRRRPIKRKTKTVLTILLCLLLAGIVAAGVALICFRPQLKTVYYRLREAFLSQSAPAYRQYDDQDGKIVIWLDPGHGGTDPGAVSPFLGEETEASINYRLSRLVKERLEAYGYTVKLAWDENTPPAEDGTYPYQDRIARANADPEADFYVCLHGNSYTDPSVSGARLYYYPDPNPYTKSFASTVAKAIGQAHGEDAPRLFPQTEADAFYVLRHATMPAFLLETLFVSNESDAAKLLDPAWLATEADGIAAGLKAFIGS
jgi:N-acetylmuramoyl-L-alanine amidase